MPASHNSKLHIPITNYHLLNASTTKRMRDFWRRKKVKGMGHYQKTNKTERATGLDRQSEDEIGKRNQMRAL